MYEIKCKPLDSKRRQLLAKNEVVPVGRPLRLVFAAGGVFLFYYGTDTGIPIAVQYAAYIFAAVGIALLLLAVFAQKIADAGFFVKAKRIGCFPGGIAVGKGGVFIRRADAKETSGKTGVVSVNAERFVSFAEIEKAEDKDAYFKIYILNGPIPTVYIFKEDFTKGDPETFLPFITR